MCPYVLFAVLSTALLILGGELGIAWALPQVYMSPQPPTLAFPVAHCVCPLLAFPLPCFPFSLLPLHSFSCKGAQSLLLSSARGVQHVLLDAQLSLSLLFASISLKFFLNSYWCFSQVIPVLWQFDLQCSRAIAVKQQPLALLPLLPPISDVPGKLCWQLTKNQTWQWGDTVDLSCDGFSASKFWLGCPLLKQAFPIFTSLP